MSWLALAALVALLVMPTELVQGDRPHLDTGCAGANYAPSPGPLRLRVFLEQGRASGALDHGALAAYLADRAARPVEVVGISAANETGFQSFAGQQAEWSEALVFLADRPFFPRVETTDGPKDALGYAAENGACLFVAFQPQPPVPCELGAARVVVQPAYAVLAHELGHALGLGHSGHGLMGHDAWQPCTGADTFDAAQRAAIAGPGSAP